ncbi:MAG TPA: sulfur carrier protein ThiS [Bacillales bacterium]|nr:sulfur carrier protein ThiS [Bacillales bacterium]
MRLEINGKPEETLAATLAELVGNYGLEKELVVVEVNGKIVDREKWKGFELENGMKIEIVHFVGGG